MNKNLFHKFVSVLILFTFLYPSVLPAVEFQDKLAAQSRYAKYFSSPKNQELLPAGFLTTPNMQVFIDAMAELNKTVGDSSKTTDDITALIGRLNGQFSTSGITLNIGDIGERIVSTGKGPKVFKKVVLTFKDGHKKDLVFLGDSREEEVLNALGISSDEDRGYLEVVGAKGLWITGHQDVVEVAAAGEAERPEIDQIYALVVTDILEGLTSEQKAIILLESSDEGKMGLVKEALKGRIEEIRTAIMWAISIYTINKIHRHAKGKDIDRGDRIDYFRTPYRNLLSWEEERAGKPGREVSQGRPILNKGRYLALAEALVERAFAMEGAPSIDTLVEGYITEEGFRMIIQDGIHHKLTRMILSSDVSWRTGLDNLFDTYSDRLSDRIIAEVTDKLFGGILTVSNQDTDRKKEIMLARLKRLAEPKGFTVFRQVAQAEDDGARIVSVPFGRERVSSPTGSYYRYQPIEGVLKYYPSALERLIAFAELFGEDTLDETPRDEEASFVGRLIKNLIIAESARLRFGAGFLNSLNIRDGEEDRQREAVRHLSIVSYITMVAEAEDVPFDINAITRDMLTGLPLKRDWVNILAQYLWFSYIFSPNYRDLAKIRKWNEDDVYNQVNTALQALLSDRYNVDRVSVSALVSLLVRGVPETPESLKVPGVLDMQREMGAVAKERVRRILGIADEVDIAAGGELSLLGAGAVKMQGVFIGDVIVLDYLMTRRMSEYVRDRNTGRIAKVSDSPLFGVDSPLPSRLGDGLSRILADNKLQLVLMKPTRQLGWRDTIQRAATVIASNLERVKTPNSVVRGEGLTLQIDADGIIYVIPDAGARDIANIERQVQDALRVQSDAARIEKLKPLRGFIDIDSRVFGIQDPAFQEILYRRLQELYNEGLYVVRVAGESIELAGDMRTIMAKFSERAGSDEWRTTSSVKTNTATLVSSDNTALADERQAASTVIRLGFDGTVSMPQIFPAVTIARAIISVGGEQNVTPDSSLFRDIKTLYLSMVPAELRGQVNAATTIAQLLAIILPPITAEDLRIYEYLLLGRKVAEVAA